MTLPSLHITNGPGQRDLELAFVAREIGSQVRFTLFAGGGPVMVRYRIMNLSFVTGHGPVYKLGGQLMLSRADDKEKLPPFNFVYVNYDTERRQGTMEFSNAE